jgi:YegS/Rv2252/BmrU family lipid kinase
MPACIIFNPAAKGDKARWFRKHLDALATGAQLKPTTAPGGARPLAEQAVREGFDTIIAAGGDGTINETVNGMGDANGFEKARLAVFPLGTANVFARELGLPFRLPKAWQVIQEGKETRVDLGLAEWQEAGQARQRYFIQLGGSGLDARSIELLDYNQKRRWGALAYILAGFRALREKKPAIRVETDGQTVIGELVLLGNGKRYGGPFQVFPHARLDDGKLDATIFPHANLRTLIRFGFDYLLCRREGIGGSRQLQATKIALKSEGNAKVPFELDGDNVGHLPLAVSACPKRLRVVCG